MRIASGSQHLTYCTNIHPADGWDAVFANLRKYAPRLRAALAPGAPFGIGLRLSARDARELLEGRALDDFRAFLDNEGLYVAIINGFPYGPFHGTPVKAAVYAPDWRDQARVRYTADLIRVLAAILPPDVDGGVSTAPLSYKPWMATADTDAWRTVVAHVVEIAATLVRLREDEDRFVHLDIEPEPDCTIENTDETIEFFERRLLPLGAPMLAASVGVTTEEAVRLLLDHVRVCFDCCHFAVEHEDAGTALGRLQKAGIRIGRAQLSSALDVPLTGDRDTVARVRERLRAFADATYLHQVVEQRPDGLRHYLDLPDALERAHDPDAKGWRIHFHVPLFAGGFGELGSTQAWVADAIGRLVRSQATTHFEIETYTWDVLPPGLKLDLFESILREYRWVLDTLAPAKG